MKVDASRYRIVPLRHFWGFWMLYMIFASLLMARLVTPVASGGPGMILTASIGAVLLLTVLAAQGYCLWMGLQSARTLAYPPLGSYVLSTWTTAIGPRARRYGIVLATLPGASIVMTLALVSVWIWPGLLTS